MPEEAAGPHSDKTLHELEADEARRSQDPAVIRRLYENYGSRLQAGLQGREDQVTQHGSVKVADWQARHLEKMARGRFVLDVGCGPRPEVSLRLASAARKIVCADISHGLVHLARSVAEKEKASNLCFVVTDAEALPFAPQTFGVVVADDIIEHVPHPERLVLETARVVADGGIVSISTPNGRAVSVLIDKLRDLMRGKLGPPDRYFLVASHLREFTRGELRSLCRQYFSKVVFVAVGWEGNEPAKRLASWLTAVPPLRGLCRHWVVQSLAPRAQVSAGRRDK